MEGTDCSVWLTKSWLLLSFLACPVCLTTYGLGWSDHACPWLPPRIYFLVLILKTKQMHILFNSFPTIHNIQNCSFCSSFRNQISKEPINMLKQKNKHKSDGSFLKQIHLRENAHAGESVHEREG